MEDTIKKYLIKYNVGTSYVGRATEREYTTFSCSKEQAIHDAQLSLSHFNNGRKIEVVSCEEVSQ